MSKDVKRTLSPARNGAVYPTIKDAKLERRLLLAGLGAAALALGMSCSFAGGAIPEYEDASVPSEDASSADAAAAAVDAGEGEGGGDS